jgi:hypothetical protein
MRSGLLTMAMITRRFNDHCKGIRNTNPIVEVEIPLRYFTMPNFLLQALQGNFADSGLTQDRLEMRLYLCDRPLCCVCFVSFESSAALRSTELLPLMQAKSHHLKRLSICEIEEPPSGDEALTEEIWRQISVANGSLSVLESLALACEFPNNNSIETIFGRMHSLACLRKLQMSRRCWLNNTGSVVIAGLRSMLCSGVQLETLELEYFDLDKEMMEHLLWTELNLNKTICRPQCACLRHCTRWFHGRREWHQGGS